MSPYVVHFIAYADASSAVDEVDTDQKNLFDSKVHWNR